MTEPSDVNRRIAETIDALRPEGDYVRAVLGGKVIAHLAETQPDLLDAWLHDHAAVFMTDYIGVRERSQRATLRRGSEAAAFGAAAKAAARRIPHTRIGKQVRFTDELLAQIIADREQPVAKPRRRLRAALGP